MLCPDRQTVTNLIVESLQKMRSDESYGAFWDRINKEIDSFHVELTISGRKRKKNQYLKKTQVNKTSVHIKIGDENYFIITQNSA